ncbi:hypothetical protein P0E66_13830 [Enterococcus faecalis]|uniref:hypothetical protein n=1 Tax=Enterococcus faecalis TaxID=1351 RepID=UPI0025B1BBE6|nr:hypothetical protein [Enterococcus faecalis]MDN3202206.1 hypothetical protein [Enterococcus faecalis]
MRDFSLLDSAIDEMERVLLGNKPREAEEIYLQNAIDFIERFKKQPELNKNQQIVLNWLKDRFNETEIKAPCLFYLWELYQSYPYDEFNKVSKAYEELKYEEEAEVIQVFIEWAVQE